MANAGIRPAGAQNVDIITITSLMISNQSATLSGVPAIPVKAVVAAGGLEQTYSIDFTISGNIISWASMGLGSILSVGDKLIVQYFTL